MRTVEGLIRRLGLQPSHLVVLGLLVVLFIVGAGLSERFGTLRNLGNIFEQAPALGFVSIGQTLVILTGGIDLSIGGIVSLSAVLMAGVVAGDPALLFPVLFGVLAFGAFIGFLNGFLVLTLRVHPLIVTLGMASVLQGSALLYTLYPQGKVPIFFEFFAYGRVAGIPTGGLVMLFLFLVFGLLLNYTRLGRFIFAVGGNPVAARLAGISVGRIILFVYAASGFFAALAGVYLVSRTGVGDPRIGEPLTLASITPVVVGGTILAGGRGGLLGTLLGVFLVLIINNLLNYQNVSTFYQWVVQGAIIVIAVSVFVERQRR